MNDAASGPERLESGWDPDTPPDDSVMLQIVHAVAGDILSLAGAAGARSMATGEFVAVDVGEAGAFTNFAVLLRPLSPDNESDVIEQISAFYINKGISGFAGIFTLWPAPDFRNHGWTLGGHPPVHYLPPNASPGSDPPDLAIRLAKSVDDLVKIVECANAAYGTESDPHALVSSRSLEDPRRRYWIAELDGRVVGGASSWLGDALTYVSLVATHPDFRRQGIGRALTWRASLVQPGKPAALLSTDEGRLLYDQVGFLRLLRMTLWYRFRNG